MEKRFRSVSRRPEFYKDLKRLKRFRTLIEDVEIFIDKALFLFHKKNIDNGGIFEIPGLTISRERVKIYKAKKFACRSLKGKGVMSGIRVIYAYNEVEDSIELIEIYYKDRDDTECDWVRIKAYCEEE